MNIKRSELLILIKSSYYRTQLNKRNSRINAFAVDSPWRGELLSFTFITNKGNRIYHCHISNGFRCKARRYSKFKKVNKG